MYRKGVSAIITEKKIQNECTDVIYPQIEGLMNESVQNKINRLIKEEILFLIPKEGCNIYEVIIGTYKVEVNRSSIISIKFDVYTYRKHAANGLTVQRSLTVNLETGKVYHLFDLFKRNNDFKVIITNIIKNQITERDLPLIKDFKGIGDFEGFYLTENALVIYFQEIEYTPHYVGIPEFPIPYAQIKNMISDEGPIARLIT